MAAEPQVLLSMSQAFAMLRHYVETKRLTGTVLGIRFILVGYGDLDFVYLGRTFDTNTYIRGDGVLDRMLGLRGSNCVRSKSLVGEYTGVSAFLIYLRSVMDKLLADEEAFLEAVLATAEPVTMPDGSPGHRFS